MFISNILLKPYLFSSRSLFLAHLKLPVMSEPGTCKEYSMEGKVGLELLSPSLLVRHKYIKMEFLMWKDKAFDFQKEPNEAW